MKTMFNGDIKIKSPKIELISVEGRNGLYRVKIDDGEKSLSISEISKIIRRPIPKIKKDKKMQEKNNNSNRLDDTKNIPLCFRCEHRARHLTDIAHGAKPAHRPRYECGDINMGVYSCYMYEPAKPVILEANKGDRRPRIAGGLLSAREHGVGVADFDKSIEIVNKRKKHCIVYWKPKNGKASEQKTGAHRVRKNTAADGAAQDPPQY
jgi:hypothetical protein